MLFCSMAGPVAPQASDPAVVIYLHGRIVEDQGPYAVSSEFGSYRYQDILDSLASGGAIVLATLRPPGADLDRFAAILSDQVDSLLRQGVAPSRITIVGFSKGAGIAIKASARLARTDLGFVLMGACPNEWGGDGLRVAGRILSIHEVSDSIGQSCAALAARALPGSVYHEHVVHTGLGHGAFYQPRLPWLIPLWIWRDGIEGTPDSTILGRFEDDYGNTYRVTAARWLQEPGAQYHVVAWDSAGEFLVARNDAENPGDGGAWTRIDWVRLPGQLPYRWGFCLTAYAAASREVARATPPPDRASPRTGCGGHPFSRMKPAS